MSRPNFNKGRPDIRPLVAKTEEEIIRSWSTLAPPLVSICCVTYNHANYIRDAINGFLAQVTDFPFEIIIRDDASTDGTADVLCEYAVKYPKIIRLVLERENQYSKGIKATPAIVKYATGEFIALCEGDDYWIRSDKLKQQVGLMRAHLQATMCVARTLICEQGTDGPVLKDFISGCEKEMVDFEDIKRVYFHTSTYLIRTAMYKKVLQDYWGKIEYGDTALRFMLADIGPFVQLREIVSIYRITGTGIWTSLDKSKQIDWEIRCTEDMYQHLNERHRTFFGERLSRLYARKIVATNWSFNGRRPASNFYRFVVLAMRYGPIYVLHRLLNSLIRVFK